MGPEVQILSGTPANNADSLCFPGLSAFLIGYLPLPGNKKAPYCYGASACQEASTLLYRECRGEHCSPAAISGNVRFHGSIWNAPLREPKRPPCVKGDSPQCGEMSRSDRGARPRERSADRRWGIVTLPIYRSTLAHAPIPPSRLTPCHLPLHKGGFAVGRRGEHCSPAAISGNARFHGSIWNAPLRRRGGFYIRPCNLGQRKTSRAHTVRPYNALFRQAEAPYAAAL